MESDNRRKIFVFSGLISVILMIFAFVGITVGPFNGGAEANAFGLRMAAAEPTSYSCASIHFGMTDSVDYSYGTAKDL